MEASTSSTLLPSVLGHVVRICTWMGTGLSILVATRTDVRSIKRDTHSPRTSALGSMLYSYERSGKRWNQIQGTVTLT
jgi:hypothetical protein